MSQRRAPKEDQLRSDVRFTLPVLSTNKSLLSCFPQLGSNKGLKLGEESICTLGDNISRIPSAARSTMRHLNTRHTEVSQWQAQIFGSIGQVDREISALEQMKDTAERCLQEKQLYSQLMSDSVAIGNSLSSAAQRQDHVLIELKKEEQLTNEIRELLQKQICILLDKLSSLKQIRTQLLADFQDKTEAIKLTTKCITYNLNTPCSRLPAGQYKPNHVSYDKWLSHCKDLSSTADNLIKDSTSFRGNLRFTLVNLKNAQERQRRSTSDALRKKVNELSRVQDTLIWERQRTRDEFSDLTKDIEKLVGQIRNCDSKLHQVTHRLDILNQRPRHELCLDQPYFSFTLEKHDLTKMAAGLRPILKRSQQDLELTHRRLMILEDNLAKNAYALEVERKCQNLHQSFLPSLDTIVVLANRPRLCTGNHRVPSYLQ
ncbi:tektin-B1-like isoform X1 [Etheostoma cragini]|uniref:tektin-B1-like isoform X1 n=1 Tax=Etheostoma cragini TaxID=417921 RepID=UPI00155DEF2E|nr:tektin-B1-like isoform X1 [Etheostoma cragini]